MWFQSYILLTALLFIFTILTLLSMQAAAAPNNNHYPAKRQSSRAHIGSSGEEAHSHMYATCTSMSMGTITSLSMSMVSCGVQQYPVGYYFGILLDTTLHCEA